jgi:hypothetical protein
MSVPPRVLAVEGLALSTRGSSSLSSWYALPLCSCLSSVRSGASAYAVTINPPAPLPRQLRYVSLTTHLIPGFASTQGSVEHQCISHINPVHDDTSQRPPSTQVVNEGQGLNARVWVSELHGSGRAVEGCTSTPPGV